MRLSQLNGNETARSEMVSETQCNRRRTQSEDTDQDFSFIQNKRVPSPLNGGFMPSAVDSRSQNRNMSESAFCHF